MKINRLFSIAAAALMMVACSSEDTALNNNRAAGPQMQFTATIAAPGSGATTRTEYTEVTTGEAAGTINVAWKVGDEIALIHNGVKDVATVKTINSDGSATIAGFITKANNGDGVEVCYPAALWEWNEKTSGAIRNATFIGNITKQDGTLKYIQDNLDVRMVKGELKVDGDNATLSASATLKSQIAIWKLTLQDDAETPAALSATQVILKVGDPAVTIASTTEDLSKTSTVYLAMDRIDEEDLTIEATVGEDTYVYTQNGVILEHGNYYQSTVTMTKMTAIDLSKLTADYTAKNGDVLTGTLNGETQPYKITIAAGATVTLDRVTINGWNSGDSWWAGITCLGDATIILKDGTTNTVKGFYEDYPGIHPAVDKTLIIKGETAGTGSLDASSNGYGPGIGGGYGIACGNIEIQGGKITATGGKGAAGIGSGDGPCGNITISGGTVTATGGDNAAGIGSGCSSIEGSATCTDIIISGGTVTATGGELAAGIGCGDLSGCGAITITSGVTKVTATKGANATNSIGKAGEIGSCGTVTIGDTEYWKNNNYVGTGSSYLTQNEIVYPTPSVALSAVTSTSYLGWRICSDGKAYAAAGPLPSGVTAVAMIAYVGNGSNCTHGLAIQLNANPASMDWSAACSYSSYPSITGNPGTWRLPSKTDWQNMFVGCAKSGDASASDNMNPIAGFKEKIGATGITWKSFFYWSSLGSGSFACYVLVSLNGSNAKAVFNNVYASNEYPVLGCLAF